MQMVNYVTRPCVVCGKKSIIQITEEEAEKLKTSFVQDVFPHFDEGTRELFISGTHPECWDELFGSSDEYDEDEDED